MTPVCLRFEFLGTDDNDTSEIIYLGTINCHVLLFVGFITPKRHRGRPEYLFVFDSTELVGV